MATTFKHLVRELNGWVKPLPPSLCPKLINKALQAIYDEYDWACLIVRDGYLIIPKAITTGLVSVNFGSNIVTPDDNLQAILDSIEDNLANPRITGRQLRIRGTTSNTVVYNIVDYSSSLAQITIDPPFLGESILNYPSFEIVKSIISPYDIQVNGIPVTDFKSFEVVADLRNQRNLHLDYLIDQYDPDRRNIGTPFALSPYTSDSNGNLRFEFYPYDKTSVDKIYRIKFYRSGITLINDNDTLSQPINEDLVLAKARIKAYEWCDANKSTKPELQKTNWQNLIAILSSESNTEGYKYLLQQAIRKDEELFPRALIDDGSSYNYFRLPHDMRDTLIISF
jgi:hypothetical protein